MRSGNFDREEMLQILDEFNKLTEGDEEIQAELINFNHLFNIFQLNEKDRLDLVFDQLLSIHIKGLMLNWLHEQLQLVQNNKYPNSPNARDEYEDILQPINTNEDPQIFIDALDFFCNEKNCNGEYFLSEDDVEELKSIGYRLPKEGEEATMTFEPKVNRNDKDLFYGFFHFIGSKMAIKKNNWKTPIINYLLSYFPSLNITKESLRSALDTPSPGNLRIIKKYFLEKKNIISLNRK